MPTNGLLLLLDQLFIKGMHICCFCILMQLLTHYDHVIVQPLIVHPVYNAKRFIAVGVVALCFVFFFAVGHQTGFLSRIGIYPNGLRYLNDGDILMLLCKSTFIPYCSLLEHVRGQEQGLSRCLNHDSFVFSTFMCLILRHLFRSCPNVPLIRMCYSLCVPYRLLQRKTLYRH